MIFGLPKLYGYAAIALAVLLAVTGIYLKGRSDGKAVVQAELDAQRVAWQQAHDAQVAETARIETEWKAKAEETERDLQGKLETATAAADDLAGRLRSHRARRCAVPQAAGGAPVPDGAGGVPADGEGTESAVDAALKAHLEACARDAVRLDGWREFWNGLP